MKNLFLNKCLGIAGLPFFILFSFADSAYAVTPEYSEAPTLFFQKLPEPDKITGSFVHNIKIETPPGRNNLQPDLGLVYSSQNNDNSDIFGYGWEISIPYIERINKKGLDTIYGENNFFSSVGGELENILNENATTTEYGLKIENGDFLKYHFENDYWVVTDKKGTQYIYGETSGSRQSDSGGLKIYRWMLEEVRDTNDNYIKYEYYKNEGQIYPSRIIYTGHGTSDGIFEVNFLRELRSDIKSSNKFGFPVKTNYRVFEINTEVNNILTRKYSLAYIQGDNGVRSLLKSITESGVDDLGSVVTLPATVFDYQLAENSWTLNSNWAPFSPSYYLRQNIYVDSGNIFADVNGDGFVDILHSKGDSRYVNINNGKGSYVANSNWLIPGSLFGDDGVRFSDVNGDGLIDVVRGLQPLEGSLINNVYINNGSGWVLDNGWSLPVPFVVIGGNNERIDNGSRFADVNGDGLDDIINAGANNQIVGVYLNNGVSGWFLNSSWSLPHNQFVDFDQNKGSIDSGNRFLDINGDGLVDFVHSNYAGNGNAAYFVKINNGDGTWFEDSQWIVPSYFSPEEQGIRFGDVNGDGLVDLIRSVGYSPYGEPNKKVYINNGTNWVEDISWTLPDVFLFYVNNYGESDSGSRLVDLNGDTIPDWNDGEGSSTGVYFNNGVKSDLLSKITTKTGNTISVEYKTAQKYFNSAGNSLNPDLPMNINTVSKIIYNDGLNNTWFDEYKYEGGKYYFEDLDNRRFAGFSIVTKTDNLGYVTKTYYHQGDETNSLKGEYDDHISKYNKFYLTEKYDNAGNLYSKIINKWDRYNLGVNRDFIKLAQQISMDYDGNTTHKDKSETYIYDDVNGNLAQKIEWGEVYASVDGTFSDIGDDKKTTTISYASDGSNIVGFLSREIVVDQNDVKTKETKFYYDGLSFGTVEKGNETGRDFWKSGTSYISTEKTYNNYGLVTQEKDGRGKTTANIYDAYYLYIASVTNPLNQITQYYYDYSSGKFKKIINQNGYVAETIYDGLDRIKTEKIPDVNNPTSLVNKKEFIYTDTAGLRKIQETNYLNNATSTDKYTYLDGLDRKIQERMETEIAGIFAVKDFEYNDQKLLNKESLPYESSGSSKTLIITNSDLLINYTYDTLGRVKTITNSDGTEFYSYDQWKTTITDRENNIKDFIKDAYENLVEVDEHNNSNTYTTNYEYDTNKNLTKITDALSNVRNFTYDGLGRRLATQDLHSSSDQTFGTWSYGYDDANNLTSKTDPKSQTVNYTYDDVNRVLTENFTGEVGTEVFYSYDFCPNGVGKLCSVMTSAVDTDYEYDALGNIRNEIRGIGSDTFETIFSYDRQGNKIQIIYPDSSVLAYVYNTAGLLEKVLFKNNGEVGYVEIIKNQDYHPSGQKSIFKFGNNIQSDYTYATSSQYRLEKIKTQKTSMFPAGFILSLAKKVADFVFGTEVVFAEELNSKEKSFKKGWNFISKPIDFDTDGNVSKYETEFHSKWINYKTDTGWEKINTDFVETKNGFKMISAPFEVYAPIRSTGTAIMRNNNKWDVSKNELIKEDSSDMSIKALGVKDVAGKIRKGDLMTPSGLQEDVNFVVYEGAYPEGDLIYYVDFGSSPRLEKLVKINSQPSLFEYSFDIFYSDEVEFSFDKNKKEKAAKGDKLKIFKNNILNVNKKGSAVRGFGFYDFVMWDSGLEYLGSNPEIKRNIVPIEAEIESLGKNSYRLTKILPKDFFKKSLTYPVYTDTTTTFYPNSGSWGAVDGSVSIYNKNEWSEAHDATFGSDANFYKTSTVIEVGSNYDGRYDISRIITMFNTSSIGSDTISSATYSVMLNTIYNRDNDGSDWATVVRGRLPSSNNITDDDFDMIGSAINNPTEGINIGNRIDFGNMTDWTYSSFQLNETGLSWINKNGITQLGVREGHDVINEAVSGYNYLYINSSDMSGTSRDPKLTVVHIVSNHAPVAPTDLVVEGLANPISITDGTPEFSAKYNDLDSGDIATHYNIQVSDNTGFSPIFWDSGKTSLVNNLIAGEQSEEISYGGNALASSTAYYWRIKFWDDSDAEGDWSVATSTFMLASAVTSVSKIQDISYIHDNLGNITSIIDASETGVSKTLQFVYDGLSRLITASTTQAESNPFSQSYSYNAIGNITNKSDKGNYTYSGTNYANPHAVTDINGTTYAYDNNGNITGIGSNSYNWDWRDRMMQSITGATTTSYTYDHNNLRVKKQIGSNTTKYPNQYYNTDGTKVTKHIFSSNGELLATIESNGTATTTHYIHADHLGGTNVVTDENGDVAQTLDYYPFGEMRIDDTSGFDETKKFTGHEFDRDSDLTYAKQRYYGQDIGKWLSQDPVFLNMGVDRRTKKVLEDPQLANAYSYARNNPLNLIDPIGEMIAQFSGHIVFGGFSFSGGMEFDHKGKFGFAFGAGGGIGGLVDAGFELTSGEISDKPHSYLENSVSGAYTVGIKTGTETEFNINKDSKNIGDTKASVGVIGGFGSAVSTEYKSHTGEVFTLPFFTILSKQQEPLLIKSSSLNQNTGKQDNSLNKINSKEKINN